MVFMDPERAPGALPQPDAEAAAHSRRLAALIQAEIQAAGGHITFARYMELALYAPGLGYYSAGARKFGAQGDFVTAPELSPLFARCVARQCGQVLRILGGGDLLEVGAGSGKMAGDVLRELEVLQALPEHYYILELSADLRARQHATLVQAVPHLLTRVIWLDTLPARLRGVIVANELLDAMPVHRFIMDVSGPREVYVARHNDGFSWRGGPLSDAALTARIQAINAELHAVGEELAPGYQSEINLAADGWVRSLAEVLEAGLILIIDYGFPRREYYHPQRSTGTLMCHYRHRAHADPLILLGLQDITAHVDFTAVAEAASAAGLTVAGYTTQASFLMACGLAEMSADVPDTRQRLAIAQQIKTLTLPGEMGELFKVLALTRALCGPLQGFVPRDLRGRL